MYETIYHRPSSVDEAAALFAKGSESKYLAGGHTLIPVMKQRLAAPSDVIDLGRIKDLIGIEVSADTLTIKAATSHYDVAVSGAAQKAIPALAYLASLIGDPAVRYRGTIGGSIANNDPAADYPAAVLALDATIKTNKRSIAADDFFKGLFSTALADGEIITAVSFPIPAKAGYSKFPHPASRFAVVGVAAVLTMDGGKIAKASIGITGAGTKATRAKGVEAAIAGKAADAASIQAAAEKGADGVDVQADLQGSEEYKKHLLKVFSKRAIEAAAAKK